MAISKDSIYNRHRVSKSQEEFEALSLFARNLVTDKENQIKVASRLSPKFVVGSLRDELHSLRDRYAQFLDNPAPEAPPPPELPPLPGMEQPTPEETVSQDPVPDDEKQLDDILFNAVAESFTTVVTPDKKQEPVFSARFSDPNTLVVEYKPEKGGVDKEPFDEQNLDQFYKPILFDLLKDVGFGDQDPEARKQELRTKLKEAMDYYRNSLTSRRADEKGKKVLVLERNSESLKMVSLLFDMLKDNGLAGLVANLNYNHTNTMGEPVMEAKKKSFNLKKANKVYDTMREKVVQKTDPQYRSRHGDHALPWYEDAYIPEEDFKQNVMDKYYPEQLNAEGEYRGGYINDRFTVHHNTEGNSMHVKPGTRTAPDRVESYSTERRLEEMRKNDMRGYELSEGSETKQQTPTVEASSDKAIVISEDNGVYKIAHGQKVTYVDTKEQAEAFEEIIKDLLDQGYKIITDSEETPQDKKKIAQTDNMVMETPENEEVGVMNVQAEDVSSPENPLLSIVTNLQKQYPQAPLERLVQEGIVQLMTSGMNTAAVEQYRVETMRALGMPVETRDYGQIDVDEQEKQTELAEMMGD